MQAAALVRGGVGDLLVGLELGQLVALGDPADAARLVGEVDLVAVPAQLPHHRDAHHAGAIREGAGADGRRAQRAGDAADRARVLRGVEDLERALDLELGVRRDGADVARPARQVGRRLALRGRRGLEGGGLLRGGRLLGDLAGALTPRAQLLDERPPPPLLARCAQRQLVAARLADPALVLGADRAQLADLAALATGEVGLGALTAQERAPAHVAGDVDLVRADVSRARHRTASLATARLGLDRLLLVGGLLHDLLRQV